METVRRFDIINFSFLFIYYFYVLQILIHAYYIQPLFMQNALKFI